MAVIVALAMAVGIAGTLVPLLPGLALVWAAGLAYGLVEGFGRVGVVAFTVMTLLALAGALAGWAVPQRAAGKAGAARTSMWLAVTGAVVGFFAIPVVGAVIGALLGLYLGELGRTGDAASAWRTTRATVIGFGLGAIVQCAVAVLMAMTWAVWFWVD